MDRLIPRDSSLVTKQQIYNSLKLKKKDVDKGILRSFEAANWTGLWIFSLALKLPLSRMGFEPTDLISTKLLD